jgi:hypothetical protein
VAHRAACAHASAAASSSSSVLPATAMKTPASPGVMTSRVSSGAPLRRAPVNSMKGFVVSSYLWPVTEKLSVSARRA